MDLLFKRYASPFVLVDQMIETCSFCDFIEHILQVVMEDQEWEFYLHKIMDKNFNDFKEGLKESNPAPIRKQASRKDIETTIQESMMITMNFAPCEEKEVGG